MEKTDMENKVIKKLDSLQPVCVAEQTHVTHYQNSRCLYLEKLSSEEREILRKLATGEIAIEGRRLKGRAINALGYDRVEKQKSFNILVQIIGSDARCQMKIIALRAIERLNHQVAMAVIQKIIENVEGELPLTLAAARLHGPTTNEKIVKSLSILRKRFITIGYTENSQNIRMLNKLINPAADC